MPKKIIIWWTYPKLISSILDSERANLWGLYQITSQTSQKEELLYIGKAWGNFNDRLKKHSKNWLDLYEGEKYVRLGCIQTKVTEQQLLEIESAIIFHTSPIHNSKSKESYKPNQEYNIFSEKYRGFAPTLIETKLHIIIQNLTR